MQTIWKRFHHAYSSRGSWVTLLSVLTILLFAAAASEAQAPIIVSQFALDGAFSSLTSAGGALAGANEGGVSWGINSMGVIVASNTYGGDIIQFSGAGYAISVVGPYSNASGVAIDSNNFLYISGQYNGAIAKIAMNATTGTYSFATDPSGSSASTLALCDGKATDDTAAGECLITLPQAGIANASGGSYGGTSSIAFDAAGDMFLATDSQGATPYTIFECTKKCIYGTGTPAPTPVMLFAEPINATAQLFVGGMALDPWGNLFFVDSAEANGNRESNYSDVNELTLSGTTYSATPTVVATETIASPGNYDDAIDAVYVDPTSGTVYFGTGNSGIYAETNNAGVVDTSSLYGIAGVGTSLLLKDAYGNFFIIGYNNTLGANQLDYVSLGGPVFTTTATTANLTIADNSEPCASTPTLSFLFSASQYSAAFVANTGTPPPVDQCTGMPLGLPGSFVPVTVTFTPGGGVTVPPTSSMVATDTTSSDSTTAVAKGSAIPGIDQSTWGQQFLSGGGWGGDAADGHSGAINSMGVVVIGSSYGGYIQEFTSFAVPTAEGGPGATTIANVPGAIANITNVGKDSGAGGIVIDSQGYLYSGGEYGNSIVKLPMNTDGTYGPLTATPTVACTGDGAAPDNAGACLITPGGTNALAFGYAALTFDKNGNLFITTDDTDASSGGQPFSVLECGTSCLYGNTAPTVIFAEPNALPAAQLYIGSIAVDSTGNIFFSDSQVAPTGSEYSNFSDLNEIPSGSSTPTILETLTPACAAAPCNYNNVIDTVSVDAAGNVYFADTNTGIYKIVNDAGTLQWATPIAIAAPGAKIIVPDGAGNFYFVGYNNTNSGDAIGFDLIGSASITPAATAATPSVASNVYVLDNFACSQSPVLTLAFSDPADEFVGTTGSCGDQSFAGGSDFTATITFTPSASASGTVTTTLTATDTTNGGTGTGQISALAATAQPITFTNPTASESVAYGAAPIVLAATGGGSGNPVTFTIDASSTTGAGSLGSDGVTLTITGVGTIVIDANQLGGVVSGVTYAAAQQAQLTITVTQAAQTISFTNPTASESVVFGAAPIVLAATGGDSGNAVTFSIDASSTAGAGSLGSDGVTLTITGVGTIVIDANQLGSANYTAATQAQLTITVTPAPQVITFTPTSPVTYSTTPITLTATGGASGNPVTFTLASGPGTLSGTNNATLTLTGVGTVVIDANQAGNTNNPAAIQVQASIVVNAAGTVATPVLSAATGATLVVGTTNTVTISDATVGATIWYTTDGTDPLTSTTATLYTSAGITLPASSSVTVTAVATLTGDTTSAETSATYSVVLVPPTFFFSVAPPSVTLAPGSSANITISVGATSAFTSTITFSCSGQPAGVTCNFAPPSITPPTTNSTVLTITDSASAALHKGSNPFLPAGATFAIALGFLGWKKRRGMFLALVLMAGMIGLTQLTACGGSSSSSGTPTTMTVTATGGGVTQTLPVAVTVIK